jgi:DNA recombination protein RmuC
MIAIILIAIALLLIINIILTIKAGRKEGFNELAEIKTILTAQTTNIKETEQHLKQEFVINRRESADTAAGLRIEMGNRLNTFTQVFSDQLANLTKSNDDKLEAIRKTIEEKLISFQTHIASNSKESRVELKENLEAFKKELNDALREYKERLKEEFAAFENNQSIQNIANNERLQELRASLERSVKTMQEGNEKKLEEMRATVDEKLQKTLETRLTQSFEIVSKNLESVQKGLGEMQQLAVGVGDLKKVLSNVKTRGILGEVQLGNILEQILAPEQYEVNVITKPGTANRVEFAIKIPQPNKENKIQLMPIDSKFPIESYYALLSAYDTNNTVAADIASRALETTIKKAAKDIHEKYISVPDTSEMGLLFLPIEGLYAAHNLCFSYKDNQVLHDVSIEIAHGHVIAIVGPSGSGKSTLLDLVAVVASGNAFLYRGEPIEFVPQHSGGGGIVGPIQQQGMAAEVPQLQPPWPAGRGQARLDRGRFQGKPRARPGSLPQRLGHGHRHGGVVALEGAGQPELWAPLRHGGQRPHPAQFRPQPLRLRLQHPGGLRRLGRADRHDPGGEHTGLFAGDAGQVGPQVFAVVEADRTKTHHRPVGMGGGGIEPAPQPHLQHREVEVGGGEAIEGRRGQQLKGGQIVPLADRPPPGQVGPQGGRVDPVVIEADPLAPAHQVGGAIGTAAESGSPQDRLQKGGDRSLAIGAGHLHGGEATFWMAPLGQGPNQAVQAQVHPPFGEGLEQVAQVDRLGQAGGHGR